MEHQGGLPMGSARVQNDRDAQSHPPHQQVHDWNFSPHTHPFATTRPLRMGSHDATNGFMYQMPVMQGFEKSMSEGGFGGDMKQTALLDLNALNERLQGLGLNEQLDSIGSFATANQPKLVTPNAQGQAPHPQRRTGSRLAASHDIEVNPTSNTQPGASGRNYFLDPNQPDPNQPYQRLYPVPELAPNDSVSMYRPAARAPSTIAASARRDGASLDRDDTRTNGLEVYDDVHSQDEGSYWSQDNITQGTPGTGHRFEEQMTVGPTSVRTRGDIGHSMHAMRNRLLAEARRDHDVMATTTRLQITDAQALATATTRLENAEKQLRDLQAKLIAEQVARTQIEQEAGIREDEMKGYQNEWASAVRALRRAREEGKKTDEEKRRLQRCFEEARDKLWKYHEALRVREARAQGKEEGRAEAWQEAERWMGGAPPIPGVEPIQALPGTVLHQTPANLPINIQSPQFQSPIANPPQQQNTQQTAYTQQTQQASQQQPNSSQMPIQSIAQLMEWFANNPGAFPQLNGNNGTQQQVAPQAQAPQQNVLSQHMPQIQTGPPAPQTLQVDPVQHGAAAQFLNKTPTPPQVQPYAQGVQHPPATLPFMTSTSQTQPMIQQNRPPQSQMSIPFQGAQPNVYHTPRTQPQQTQRLSSSQTQPTRFPPNSLGIGVPTALSTTVHLPMPEPASNPHLNDSYLDRVEHDPELKKMMAGDRSKTIHTSMVPSTTDPAGNGGRSHINDSVSHVDKPLPPLTPGNGNPLGRSQTTRPAAKASSTNGSSRRPRRMSLSDGLRNYDHHHRPMSQIPDGDRYPVFPLQGQNGGIDPANIGLPSSRDPSNFQSPNSDFRGRNSEMNTPSRGLRNSNVPSSRNRMAGALRGDLDLEPELGEIEEVDEESRPVSMIPANQAPPSLQQGQIPISYRGAMASSARASQMPPRPAPSMPNMRHRVNPVMPQPLSQPRARSDYQPRLPPQPNSISALYNDRQNDPAARVNDSLLEPESMYHPPKSHDMFVPPKLAPATISGAVEDIQGARTSALGLSGVGSERGEESNRMKAPTITVQPPSSRSRSNNPTLAALPSQMSPETHYTPTPATTIVAPSIITSGKRDLIVLDTPPGERGERFSVDIPLSPSAYSQAKTHIRSHSHNLLFHHQNHDIGHGQLQHEIEPRNVPLPSSRSVAPTSYTHAPSTRSHARSHSQPQGISRSRDQRLWQPHDIPLPATRSVAPTAYSYTPDNSSHENSDVTHREVKTVEYAREVLLPGGKETVYDQRTTVSTATDEDNPPIYSHAIRSRPSSRQTRAKVGAPQSGQSYKGNGSNVSIDSRNGIDPKMYPLPPSRSTIRKASTYATSVPPIEEVTEPESIRENLRNSRKPTVSVH
ncbi:hypothetical protein L204_100459 [Cryptococcus depauperatus]